MSEENEAILGRFKIEWWDRKNLAAVDDFCWPDVVLHSTVTPGPIRGAKAFKHYFGVFFAAFPDAQLIIDEMVSDRGTVSYRWRIPATHLGELTGIPPTGTRIEMTGINFVHIVDGRIKEMWIAQDVFGLMRQLGVIPSADAGLKGVLRALLLGPRVAAGQKRLDEELTR